MRRARRACRRAVFEAGVPVLGICYGEQAMVAALGGKVEGGHAREFGRAAIEITGATPLFEGVWQPGERAPVWMSHGDRVTKLPPGFRAVAVSRRRALRGHRRRCAPPLWRPVPSRGGAYAGRRRAASRISCARSPGCAGDWTMAQFRASEVARIRAQVGEGRVICGLSGGVDSSVAALLIHEAIGDQLTCIFVDNGLLRQGEARGGGAPVPRPLQHPARGGRCVRALSRRAQRRRRSGGEAQDHRPAVHRGVRGGSGASWARSISSPKARSIPT